MCEKKTQGSHWKITTSTGKMARKLAAARSYKVRTQLFLVCLFDASLCEHLDHTPRGTFLPITFPETSVAFLWFYGPHVHLSGSSEGWWALLL